MSNSPEDIELREEQEDQRIRQIQSLTTTDLRGVLLAIQGTFSDRVSRSLQNEAILHQAGLSQIERENEKGLISSQEYSREKNRLAFAIDEYSEILGTGDILAIHASIQTSKSKE